MEFHSSFFLCVTSRYTYYYSYYYYDLVNKDASYWSSAYRYEMYELSCSYTYNATISRKFDIYVSSGNPTIYGSFYFDLPPARIVNEYYYTPNNSARSLIAEIPEENNYIVIYAYTMYHYIHNTYNAYYGTISIAAINVHWAQNWWVYSPHAGVPGRYSQFAPYPFSYGYERYIKMRYPMDSYEYRIGYYNDYTLHQSIAYYGVHPYNWQYYNFGGQPISIQVIDLRYYTDSIYEIIQYDYIVPAYYIEYTKLSGDMPVFNYSAYMS